jgi:hypothetical protein
MGKSKAEQRREAIERLRNLQYVSINELTECNDEIAYAISDGEREVGTLKEIVDKLIYLLTDDESDERYMRLPVDADGVPIHVGDTLEWHDGERLTVIGIGSGVVFYEDDEGVQWTMTGNKRHCTLSVEDVLREFVGRWLDTEIEDEPALYDEYTKKLRLKEDDDEA